MNGRVYDPVVGRFLSPDPYVQMPGSVDGFNRYAYCLNNLLIYTDPDGELVQFLPLVAYLVGTAIIGGTYFGSDVHGEWNWERAWKGAGASTLCTFTMLASTALPAFTGPASFSIMPYIYQAVGIFASQSLNTASISYISNGEFKPNYRSALISTIPIIAIATIKTIDIIAHSGNPFTGRGYTIGEKIKTYHMKDFNGTSKPVSVESVEESINNNHYQLNKSLVDLRATMEQGKYAGTWQYVQILKI